MKVQYYASIRDSPNTNIKFVQTSSLTYNVPNKLGSTIHDTYIQSHSKGNQNIAFFHHNFEIHVSQTLVSFIYEVNTKS